MGEDLAVLQATGSGGRCEPGDSLNTHNAFIKFGRHRNERITRLPVSYLTWGVNNEVARLVKLEDGSEHKFHEVAQAELARRGERSAEVEVSSHAVDRLTSGNMLGLFISLRETKDEGAHTFLERLTLLAWDAYKKTPDQCIIEDDTVKVPILGFRLVILKDLAVPTLKTILPKRDG